MNQGVNFLEVVFSVGFLNICMNHCRKLKLYDYAMMINFKMLPWVTREIQYKQNKLIELFVSGVTAEMVVRLVSIKNTEVYYRYRLHLFMFYNSPHLEIFDGKVDSIYLGEYYKERRAVVR